MCIRDSHHQAPILSQPNSRLPVRTCFQTCCCRSTPRSCLIFLGSIYKLDFAIAPRNRCITFLFLLIELRPKSVFPCCGLVHLQGELYFLVDQIVDQCRTCNTSNKYLGRRPGIRPDGKSAQPPLPSCPPDLLRSVPLSLLCRTCTERRYRFKSIKLTRGNVAYPSRRAS